VSARAPAVVAAIAWSLFCLRWFDVAASWRPAALQAIPPFAFALLLVSALAALLRRHAGTLSLVPEGASRRELWMLVALAVAFRFPMAWTAAAGYTSSDGSLSGTVALRVREGLEHLVFVPNVPYSGSLKSHVAAALGLAIDLQRAFTLASVAFYALFVAALYALAAGRAGAGVVPRVAAALYAVFAPAFVTRYSLSNDGNYVEVLALGTLALFWAVRAAEASDGARRVLAWAAGTALGLGFWCHILVVIHAAAVGLLFLWADPRGSLRVVPRLGAGFALGALPSLLWNAANEWGSFVYLLPGGQSVGSIESGPAWTGRVAGMVREHLPILAGYDLGYTGLAAVLVTAFAALALGMIVFAYAHAARRVATRRDWPTTALLLFTAINLAIAAFGLPYIPWNARYLQFLVAPIAVFVAETFASGGRRALLGVLIAGGALTSLAQWPGEAVSDAKWRAFVEALPRAGVTRCYTDFYLAAKIDFISEERVVCSSELGPTTTEYFLEFRERVDTAARAALIPVNRTAAEKLERKLTRLGVAYERFELMKPVIVPERRVPPAELFARE
jgi:hypothetical protein